MKIKIIIITAVIASVGIVGYFTLGGAEDVKVTHGEVNDYIILGKEYNGRYRSEELRNIFDDVKNKLDSGIIEGVMVVVNYNIAKDSLDNGFIHQFLGIDLRGKACLIFPKGFKPKEIKVKSAITATIVAHNLVMPSPEEIDEQIKAYALLNNLKTVGYSIENYISDRELEIVVPILE